MFNSLLFFKIFLILYFIVYIYVIAISKKKSFYKKFKINPLIVKKGDGITYFLQQSLNAIIVFNGFMIIIYSFFYSIYNRFFFPIYFLFDYKVQIFGIVLLLFAVLLIRISQNQMKSSWRIGVNFKQNKTKLITSGLYSISRNPIALGFNLTTIGLFLTLPNFFSGILVILNFFVTHKRIIIEEKYLRELHGDEYLDYKRKTRRWI